MPLYNADSKSFFKSAILVNYKFHLKYFMTEWLQVSILVKFIIYWFTINMWLMNLFSPDNRPNDGC